MFIFTIFLGSSIYNPDILKLLIQAGLPLNYLSGLPVLGDAIRAAEAPQISVQKLKQLIDNEDKNLLLIDVRSPEEYEYGSIPTAILVPLTDIEQGKGIDKIKSLIPGHKLVTYCSKGPRSNKALELLRKAGIEGANLQGGIYEWRAKIDPSMPEP
ncbi:MAG TPA: rhodanese-like domain-containing protein [Nostocaceae cyanobacterium]|nr:rhodanese-like domain-containing protein [Nostocaceae cyanobacterium]